MKMITINSCARASTKPGQMSMLERRALRGAIGIVGRTVGSAPGVFRQGGNGARDNTDVVAQILDALLSALDHVFAEPSHVGFDIPQVIAQHVVMSEGVLHRLGQSGERGL